MFNKEANRLEQFGRLAEAFGEKNFGRERMKRITFLTRHMNSDGLKKMVDFFLDNSKYAPRPKDFEDYAKSHGFTTGISKPQTNCNSCKNKGCFTAINEKGNKFHFDCPRICEWNVFNFGKKNKNPWKSEYRDQGFKLEHEVMNNIEMTDVMANSIKLGVISFAKSVLKGTGYDRVLEDYERDRRKAAANPRHMKEPSTTKNLFDQKINSKPKVNHEV